MIKKVGAFFVLFFIFFAFFVVIPNNVFSAPISTTPGDANRIRELEQVAIYGIVALWTLSIPYFIVIIAMIGFQWMTSMGDENKIAGLKQRVSNVGVAFALVFGGYLVVQTLFYLLGFRNPEDSNNCFGTLAYNPITNALNSIIFQFFFVNPCTP